MHEFIDLNYCHFAKIVISGVEFAFAIVFKHYADSQHANLKDQVQHKTAFQ